MLRKCLVLFVIAAILLVYSSEAVPWGGKTHKLLSSRAAGHSKTNKTNYLQTLGLEGFKQQQLERDGVTQTIVEWIQDGAALEDETIRWLNHFHNPRKPWSEAGLADVLPGESSVLWAQHSDNQQSFTGGDWSWKKARDCYHKAFTASTDKERKANFANMFRGLGHQMHHIQDAAVPAHVRNDAHPRDSLGATYDIGFEKWANEDKVLEDVIDPMAQNPEFPNLDLNVLIEHKGERLVPITQLIDTVTGEYTGKNPAGGTETLGWGMAEYTNANFFSDSTIFAAEKYSKDHKHKHYHPYPKKSSTDLQKYLDWELIPKMRWEHDEPELHFHIAKVDHGEEITHFLKPGYYTNDLLQVQDREPVQKMWHQLFYRDRSCHKDYAEKLIPRLVGYSAALLDYFFRGKLEIAAPEDAHIYAIIDGGQDQQFQYLGTRVKNSTPDEKMGEGTLRAVASYRIRPNYEPDLSGDPPTWAEMKDVEFSYSVSEPIAIDSMSATAFKEFVFDFSREPIPVGITDLYLHVIFKGTLGKEKSTAVAAGIKDLNEPQHEVYWNATDRFYLDKVLRTADEIRRNPDLKDRVDFDQDGIVNEHWEGEPFIDPYDVETKIAFYPVGLAPAYYNATWIPLAPGRYGRVIVLTDKTKFYTLIDHVPSNPLAENRLIFLTPGVVNQEIEGVWHNTQVYTFRGVISHQWTGYNRYYPSPIGIKSAPWPGPADVNPYPATDLYPIP